MKLPRPRAAFAASLLTAVSALPADAWSPVAGKVITSRSERVLLNFEAVAFESCVWLNGALVGHHAGGSTASFFDLTEDLRDGDNDLLVSVWDPTSDGEQPRGNQILEPRGIWYTPVSGIWQTVWLEPVPKTGRFAEPRFTSERAQRRVKVEALVDQATDDDIYAVRLTAFAEGKTVATLVMRANRSCTTTRRSSPGSCQTRAGANTRPPPSPPCCRAASPPPFTRSPATSKARSTASSPTTSVSSRWDPPKWPSSTAS